MTMRFAVALILVAACNSRSTDGLPPATDWSTGDPGVGGGEVPRGVPNPDPHGGGAKVDPHEGVAGAPPLTDDQIPNDPTHAHVEPQAPDDPAHAGIKDSTAPIDPKKRIKG